VGDLSPLDSDPVPVLPGLESTVSFPDTPWTEIVLESIADPVRLRIVRHLDAHGAASLGELAEAVGVHFNTARPHVQALEADGVLQSRQRPADGPGRRVIEYSLAEPLSGSDADLLSLAELLAAALARSKITPPQLRRIGADWGRYLAGRPGTPNPLELVEEVLTRLGYRARATTRSLQLERCLCPLVAPDSPLQLCTLVEGVIEGVFATAGSELRIQGSDHDPDARSCELRLAKAP
jgi:predicted ArsR family transcriptional regulator